MKNFARTSLLLLAVSSLASVGRGQDLPAGQCVQLLGADVIASFRIYSAGHVNAEYFK